MMNKSCTGIAIGLVAACAAPQIGREPTMDKGGYLLLADGSVHAEATPPRQGLFVRGLITGEGFVPTGDIEGDGDMSQAGTPGWMELRDGSFHGDMTARPPFPPYVRGVMQSDGRFAPASRQVHR